MVKEQTYDTQADEDRLMTLLTIGLDQLRANKIDEALLLLQEALKVTERLPTVKVRTHAKQLIAELTEIAPKRTGA
jgi:hypothetical protein